MVGRKLVPLGKVYPDLQKMLDAKDLRIKELEATQASYAKQIESLHHEVDTQYALRKDDAKAFNEKIASIEAKLHEGIMARHTMPTPPTNCMYGPACGNHVKGCDEATEPPRCFSTSIGTNKKSGGASPMVNELEATIAAIALLTGASDTTEIRSAISKQNQLSGDRPQAIANAMLVKIQEAKAKTTDTK